MCLELMLEVPGRRIVHRPRLRLRACLSIAAAKLGFDPVLGVDADRAAVEETDRNAPRQLRRGGGAADRTCAVEPVPVADVVAANLTAGLCGRWRTDGRRAASGRAP